MIFKKEHTKTIEALTQSNEEWMSKYQSLEKQLTEAQDTIGNFMVEKENHEKALTDMKADYEGKLAKLVEETNKTISDKEASVEQAEESAEAKAAAIVANIGIPADEIPKVISNEIIDVIAHYESLKGAERSAYLNNNKQQILNAYAKRDARKI